MNTERRTATRKPCRTVAELRQRHLNDFALINCLHCDSCGRKRVQWSTAVDTPFPRILCRKCARGFLNDTRPEWSYVDYAMERAAAISRARRGS